MYETERKSFDELVDELGVLEAMPEIEQDTAFETKKREVEYKILQKGYLKL